MRTSIFLADGDPADEEAIRRLFRLNRVLNEVLVFRDGEETACKALALPVSEEV